MSNKILFGTAGIPHSAKKKDSVYGIKAVKENTLDAMELEFVRGVRLSEKKALEIRKTAMSENISLSCHAPYYINLNSKEDEKIEASIQRIVKSAQALFNAGGKNVVFHCGYYQDISKEKTLENMLKNLKKTREKIDSLGMEEIILRPELTGKKSQFGSEEELVILSKEVRNTLPCIDFSHFYTRYIGERPFEELFSFLDKNLPDFFKNIHCHLSGIEYTDKGEKKHLNFVESGIDYVRVLELLVEYNAAGSIICESPSLENDATILKNAYLDILKSKIT